MAAWVRFLMAAVVLVVPGGFLFLLAYLSGRAIHGSYVRAAEASADGEVTLRDVLAQVSFRDVVAEARAGAGLRAA